MTVYIQYTINDRYIQYTTHNRYIQYTTHDRYILYTTHGRYRLYSIRLMASPVKIKKKTSKTNNIINVAGILCIYKGKLKSSQKNIIQLLWHFSENLYIFFIQVPPNWD